MKVKFRLTVTTKVNFEEFLPDLIDSQEVASITYMDDKPNDPSITKITGHVKFNNKSLIMLILLKLLSYPNVGDHFTAKLYEKEVISNSVDE